MHEEILTAGQEAVLQTLKDVPSVSGFYLAGGTALALHIGHRRSVDFDFFRPDPFEQDRLEATLTGTGLPLSRRTVMKDTLYVVLGGVTTSFFRYDHSLLEPSEPTPWGFGLASIRDIAAMKIEAILGRGARKDFVDAYFLFRDHLPVVEALRACQRKYRLDEHELLFRLRPLTYFGDAEREPMPDMLVPFDWRQARTAIEGWTRDATRELLGA